MLGLVQQSHGGRRCGRAHRQRQRVLPGAVTPRDGGNGHCPSLFLLVVAVPGTETLPPPLRQAPHRRALHRVSNLCSSKFQPNFEHVFVQVLIR
ncbi:hypothetical protein GCM10017566_70070 [Amycolatopsis bartoniae]|uniref:Uncharacterized protein n=1 Tax=Amycolatopsis bartoniae TaxID=941986 RepID=A0A8H9J714_9PSEU|nr:hypothetical protein GCM10017566_70070 [Amycolatopsis bartoniae]